MQIQVVCKRNLKERHAMKCETQCHMVCLKHPSFVLLFLGSQKLIATNLAVPIMLPLWTNTFQTNPKNGEKKIKKIIIKKNWSENKSKLFFCPHWSQPSSSVLLSQYSIPPLEYIIHSLSVYSPFQLHFANRYSTGWSSLTYTPPSFY